MTVAFCAQVIANLHDNSQALHDDELALSDSPVYV